MSPSARELLLHILDETSYLLSASDQLNQAEFLVDPTLKLAQLTEHTKAFHLRQLIEAGLDDLEDAYLGAAVAERIRLGQERTYSLDDVVSELGLDPAAL
jgi:RHH-type rel operon transcriptional repressor/antitoxin RelB